MARALASVALVPARGVFHRLLGLVLGLEIGTVRVIKALARLEVKVPRARLSTVLRGEKVPKAEEPAKVLVQAAIVCSIPSPLTVGVFASPTATAIAIATAIAAWLMFAGSALETIQSGIAGRTAATRREVPPISLLSERMVHPKIWGKVVGLCPTLRVLILQSARHQYCRQSSNWLRQRP